METQRGRLGLEGSRSSHQTVSKGRPVNISDMFEGLLAYALLFGSPVAIVWLILRYRLNRRLLSHTSMDEVAEQRRQMEEIEHTLRT